VVAVELDVCAPVVAVDPAPEVAPCEVPPPVSLEHAARPARPAQRKAAMYWTRWEVRMVGLRAGARQLLRASALESFAEPNGGVFETCLGPGRYLSAIRETQGVTRVGETAGGGARRRGETDPITLVRSRWWEWWDPRPMMVVSDG